mmetsp:Transcript_3718/g.12020  ORF Transcript_3718/g.12020 Transcript_3718/m.12020 type:complete len:222 (-) Transcript_3718:725-1390(-)
MPFLLERRRLRRHRRLPCSRLGHVPHTANGVTSGQSIIGCSSTFPTALNATNSCAQSALGLPKRYAVSREGPTTTRPHHHRLCRPPRPRPTAVARLRTTNRQPLPRPRLALLLLIRVRRRWTGGPRRWTRMTRTFRRHPPRPRRRWAAVASRPPPRPSLARRVQPVGQSGPAAFTDSACRLARSSGGRPIDWPRGGCVALCWRRRQPAPLPTVACCAPWPT